MDTVWPATVTVPVRELAVEFCWMRNVVEPRPVPLAPLEMVIQLTVLVALHEHCVPVMMLIVRLLAVESTVKLVGDTL